MTIVVDILSWIFLVAGGAFCIIGMIGIIRLPDMFARPGVSVVAILDLGVFKE